MNSTVAPDGDSGYPQPCDDQSLRSFLRDLEARGELIRFAKPVDPVRNMSAVEWKTYNELGKSSLFTHIEGHSGWMRAAKVEADLLKVLKMPDVRERMEGLGVEPTGTTASQLGAIMRTDRGKWDKVIKAANIRLD